MSQAQVDRAKEDPLRKNVRDVRTARRSRIRHTTAALHRQSVLNLPKGLSQASLLQPHAQIAPFASLFQGALSSEGPEDRVTDLKGLLATKRRLLAPVQATLQKRIKAAHDQKQCASIISTIKFSVNNN